MANNAINRKTLKNNNNNKKLSTGEVLRNPRVVRQHLQCFFISLTKGKFAIVDGKNYEWLNQWKWKVNKVKTQTGNIFYAVRQDKKGHTIYMHRLILGLKDGDKKHTDHINHNGLDNRIYNLRICTSRQNQQNKRLQGKTSKYKGVYWRKDIKKWHAQIGYNYKNIFLGFFNNEIEAAKAYDTKAKELFGEFALTNLSCVSTFPIFFLTI